MLERQHGSDQPIAYNGLNDEHDTAVPRADSSYLAKWIDGVKSLLLYGEVSTDSCSTNCSGLKLAAIEYNNRSCFSGEFTQSRVGTISYCDGQPQGNRDYIHKLALRISSLINDMDVQRRRERLLLTKLTTLREEMASCSTLLETDDLFMRLRHYKRMTLKYELMKLSKAITQLQNYQHVKDIPSLVFGILNNNSLLVLPQLRIHKVIKDTVKSIKNALLTQFHKLFEDHLLDTQGDDGHSIRGDSESSDKSSLWLMFLSQARDWLLAYALVYLLPVVLTETNRMVLDAFKEALDEALTPIWGRFHYHLEIARQARSSLQIVWTFNYCRSFVQMVCDLSAQMTASKELKRLCDVDYANAGLQQVLQKAVKFMRAHIALTITEFSPLTQELCIQVVEETLELDHWFYDLVSLFPGYRRGINAVSSDTICPVLYDSKETFHQWIVVEHEYYKSRLLFKVAKTDKIYAFRFTHARIKNNINNNSKSDALSNVPCGQYRCYSGVFDCIGLFFTVCNRYMHLPDPAQRVLSVYILEPLLCTAIALLLYRIRSNRTLFKISLGSYTRDANKTDSGAETTEEYPTEFLEFIDSARYVQACFCDVDEKVRGIKGRSSTLFRQECWSVIQTWMPKVLINRKDQLDGEHSITALIEKIWSLSDDIIHARNNFSYRASLFTTISAKKGRLPAATAVDASNQSDVVLMGCVGDCVDVARTLAATLCNVMNTQMKSNAV